VPPMNLLGPELVRDLVSIIQQAKTENAVQVLVFKSADLDYFNSHVDVKRIEDYREEAAKLTGEAAWYAFDVVAPGAYCETAPRAQRDLVLPHALRNRTKLEATASSRRLAAEL